MRNYIIEGVYRAFFNNKPFKELKIIDVPESAMSGGYMIYEVWFFDNSLVSKSKPHKPAQFSHNIVIPK